ncbi:4-diphosphocytidyl-2-C-methyl-D-erythritol kinase [Roseibacterium elongatum DSM 19469]|uniref:4-diphosphocytidyl-2-C-methyl-D-erythritol kinase n=1 Tax=Roseicyclus elongatus DSM 19469 TaxID=1294273 RepID=W8RRQ0_9RHOB|nr:4-(cytidine 5'-diphospho)-2-C-methyl-D-erythritol kinase [Roseibacterium elongatum]AHM03854.1 4-diphosphocytidyl-2-C-methyl-D-erythritol kinase [Roseibacterium elongatum DSM 19469]
MIQEFAPAKVNLALHVTGRRDDGYHLLDSIVVFADIGDRLTISDAPDLSLSVTGPRAADIPTDSRNLVWRAAEWLAAGRGAAITLDKTLPPAGGIGGGSSDAASALRGLSDLWARPRPAPQEVLPLGADVPVCLFGRPARMQGIGEVVCDLPDLPALWMVLANAGVEVPTGPVFKALTHAENAALPEPDWTDLPSLVAYLCHARNDLEAPARALVPVIGEVLDHLEAQPGCLLARMSGSGGTCFGLFGSAEAAQMAAARIGESKPDWWVDSGAVRAA